MASFRQYRTPAAHQALDWAEGYSSGPPRVTQGDVCPGFDGSFIEAPATSSQGHGSAQHLAPNISHRLSGPHASGQML